VKRRIFVNYTPDYHGSDPLYLLRSSPEIDVVVSLCSSTPIIDITRGLFDKPVKQKFHTWDLLREEAEREPGALEVLVLGPLTDVAIAFLRWPDLPGKIKRLTVSGGSLFTGNTLAYSEMYFAFDPYAASLVFKSGVPLTVATLDTEDLMREAGLPASYQYCAALAAFEPAYVTLTSYFAEIETRSSLSRGQVVVDRDRRGLGKPNAGFVTGINIEKADYHL